MRSATEEFILSPSSPDREDVGVGGAASVGDFGGRQQRIGSNGSGGGGGEPCLSDFADRFIKMRCTDSFLGGMSIAIGVLAILLQTIAFSSDNWLWTVEPREINWLDEESKKNNRTELFSFNSGYWRSCWSHGTWKILDPPLPARNYSALPPGMVEYFATDDLFKPQCKQYLHTESDVDEIMLVTKATGAILNRLLLSAMLHMVSIGITVIGLVLAVLGRLRHDIRTFISAVIYIISGILMSVAVMQYVCVVDDEMSSKMRKTPEGDDSPYAFMYGWAFWAASVSFVCIETCALIELLLYLRRYPSLEDKMHIVPGLQDKVQRAVLNHEFDDIVPQRLGSRRNSPRISLSYYTDTV